MNKIVLLSIIFNINNILSDYCFSLNHNQMVHLVKAINELNLQSAHLMPNEDMCLEEKDLYMIDYWIFLGIFKLAVENKHLVLQSAYTYKLHKKPIEIEIICEKDNQNCYMSNYNYNNFNNHLLSGLFYESIIDKPKGKPLMGYVNIGTPSEVEAQLDHYKQGLGYNKCLYNLVINKGKAADGGLKYTIIIKKYSY